MTDTMTDTFRTLLGNIADDAKKALDDILDRPSAGGHGTDLLTRHLRLQAVANLPADALQTLGKLAALESLGEQGARKILRGDTALSTLTGLSGAAAPVAGLTDPLAAATGAAGGAADLATALASLPGQVAQLQENVAQLAKALEALQNLGGTLGQATGTGNKKSS
ncbi:hypothetical protein [Streptomyces sp. NPDC046261]|uniref:hypothetical protein n=1 Tax=Streptomyces sp. NPDC046261 TaxID=3157200 RepID=UPI0033E9D51E